MMVEKYDSEVYFTWELEAFNALEVAEKGEHAEVLKIEIDEKTPEEITTIIQKYNAKNGTLFDSFELTQCEHYIGRYIIK